MNLFVFCFFVLFLFQIINCEALLAFGGCSTCCAGVHAPEFPLALVYGAKVAACILKCIPLDLRLITYAQDPGMFFAVQQLKQMAGGFDIRDLACTGINFVLKKVPFI